MGFLFQPPRFAQHRRSGSLLERVSPTPGVHLSDQCRRGATGLSPRLPESSSTDPGRILAPPAAIPDGPPQSTAPSRQPRRKPGIYRARTRERGRERIQDTVRTIRGSPLPPRPGPVLGSRAALATPSVCGDRCPNLRDGAMPFDNHRSSTTSPSLFPSFHRPAHPARTQRSGSGNPQPDRLRWNSANPNRTAKPPMER
jgi:hypothetical protein